MKIHEKIVLDNSEEVVTTVEKMTFGYELECGDETLFLTPTEAIALAKLILEED